MSTTFKVLIFTPVVGRGGVKLCVETMLRGYKEYAPPEWEFRVLGQALDEIGLPINYSGYPFEQVKPINQLPLHPYLFPYLLAHADDFMNHLRAYVDEWQPDLVMCYGAWWVARAKRWDINAPIVTFLPDFAFDQGVSLGDLLNEHFRYAANLLARRASFSIFSAEFHREHAVNHYRFAPEKTAVVQHSADFVKNGLKSSKAEGRRVAKAYGLPSRYVLAFHPMGHKDPQTILRAQRYARMHGENVPELVLAGIHTEQLLDSRNRRARRMLDEVHAHLNEDVFVTGFVEEADIGGLFANAVCSISASHSEGDLSGATLTSFMCKVPHLWSRLPVYLDRLHEGLGYSFDVGDHEALGKLIVEVTDHPVAAERKALAAFKWAQTRTIKNVIAEYLSIFTGVIDDQANA